MRRRGGEAYCEKIDGGESNRRGKRILPRTVPVRKMIFVTNCNAAPGIHRRAIHHAIASGVEASHTRGTCTCRLAGLGSAHTKAERPAFDRTTRTKHTTCRAHPHVLRKVRSACRLANPQSNSTRRPAGQWQIARLRLQLMRAQNLILESRPDRRRADDTRYQQHRHGLIARTTSCSIYVRIASATKHQNRHRCQGRRRTLTSKSEVRKASCYLVTTQCAHNLF